MAELEGKVAIVTGSGRCIGKAVAKVFAREGAKVVVASRTPATVEAVAQEIRDEGHTALSVPTDVSQKDQILAMVATTVEHYGTVDILINNAGITRDNILVRMKEDEWDEIIDTNLSSVYKMSKAVLRGMIRLIHVARADGNNYEMNPRMKTYFEDRVGLDPKQVQYVMDLSARIAKRVK